MRFLGTKILPAVLAVSFAPGICAANSCTSTFIGAVGDGFADDTAAVQNAFDQACSLDGAGRTFSVSGTMTIRHDITVSNARFVQRKVITLPDERLYTLHKHGGAVKLVNVVVDRGLDERNGVDIQASAAILLEGVVNSTLKDVSVTGNGYGNGIWVLDSNHVTLDGVRVHDMRWSTAQANSVGFERVLGLLIQRSRNVDARDVTVERILGEDGDNQYEPAGSDGITVAHSDNVLIERARISWTGEGIDFTGSGGNTNFTVADSETVDIDAFGFKFANSAKNGLIRNSRAIRTGYAGFVFSGPAEANLPLKTESIIVTDCEAIDTGYNMNWVGFNVSGFFIQEGSYDKSYPRNISIINSRAEFSALGASPMKYGFLSQVTGNRVFNVNSVGHTVEGAHGF